MKIIPNIITWLNVHQLGTNMSANITPPPNSSLGVSSTLDAFHSVTSTTAPPDTLVKICLLWTVLHRTVSLPPACKGVISEDKISELRTKGDFGNMLSNINYDEKASRKLFETKQKADREQSIRYHYQYSSRSLSVIGVLGGIVLILMLVAMSTCIKNRRQLLVDNDSPGHERFARQILIDHIRHLSSSRRTPSASAQNDTPPAYEDVVKPSSSSSNASGSEPSPPYRLTENGNGDEDDDDDDNSQPPSYIEALEQNVSQNPGGTSGDHVVQIELGQSDGASSLQRHAQTV
ncbi:hypothetical protein TCAL_02287 [Tigriopus californicus]|uniref:Uncharacterized protein n=1 Tax=Tigriopus californicus TaxID=6832 RepID=A0A553NP17_TIGCA|nr:uncharacterized protein LOC131879661 isoform X2 [Tigriopus californicus]TRY67182.1 hypothetical protein TCAL_02287 [Tigriopus californicus]|eukprot:TCALIF_02287-PA protein Name:"Protein of unknown function" AED:0.00 eAED:0.00 QI:185/1/1/1/0/0.33/3/74/290